MKKILVTGANGQLGRCLKDALARYSHLEVTFTHRSNLDLDDPNQLTTFLKQGKFDYCINTAAYTNVEKAESESDAAYKTNSSAVEVLAKVCAAQNTTLIHISTDYVFDGKKNAPYTESDEANPISVYGDSKLQGELAVQKYCPKHFIFRTSWLYSQYGHNFLNSMLRFAKEGRDLSITTEQLGTPTNANDLAGAILHLIDSGNEDYGLYHFSNQGEATWFDFAEAIFQYTGQLKSVSLAKTNHYRTFAKRPEYSVLDKSKFSTFIGYPLIHWKDSLQQLIEKTKNDGTE